MKNTAAIIMAGGQAKRMGILCHHRPKPILPFAGMYRIIDFTLSNCINSGIGRIAVLTDHQRSYMTSYLGRWHTTTSGNTKSKIDALAAKAYYLGTADAVYQNLGYLKKQGVDKVLILASDHIYKMDYNRIIDFHEQTEADVTIGVIPMSPEQTQRFGTVTVNASNRILNFTEKAKIPVSSLVSMGIYVFKLKNLMEYLVADATNPDSFHDFGYSIIPRIVKNDRVFAYQFEGYWQDIGTVESYYTANIELTSQRPPFSLDGDWPIVTAGKYTARPNVSPTGRIFDSIVSPGCTIKGNIINSVVSPGAFIEEGAIIRNSVLMGNIFIGQDSIIESCIVDEDVSIGRFCNIGAEPEHFLPAEDIRILSKDTVIASYTTIGHSLRSGYIAEAPDDEADNRTDKPSEATVQAVM